MAILARLFHSPTEGPFNFDLPPTKVVINPGETAPFPHLLHLLRLRLPST